MAKKLVIAGVSAMQAWDEGAGSYARPTRLHSPASFATSAAELAEFTRLPQGCTQPVQILVGDGGNRARTAKWDARWRLPNLPAGALVDIEGDRLLVSPEQFFLDTVPKLTLAQGVTLGLELCGYHSTLMSAPYRAYRDAVRQEQGGVLLADPWPPADWDMSAQHQRDLMENGFVTRPPLSDSVKLALYVRRVLSDKSNSRALTASRFIQDGSHSPMESRLYLRYCLPRRYGGLNLRPVELNRGFEISMDLANATGITNYSVDLYWPDGGIAIEYQGEHAHSGLSAEQKDRLKRNILEVFGVRVISIDWSQYANEDILELYGREIAKSLGIAPWELKPRGSEVGKRLALADELRSWDVDLYRPPYMHKQAKQGRRR